MTIQDLGISTDYMLPFPVLNQFKALKGAQNILRLNGCHVTKLLQKAKDSIEGINTK